MYTRIIKIAIIVCMIFSGCSVHASLISVDVLAHTDPFHFVFVTSAKTNSVSDDINHYNNLVHIVADYAGISNDIGQPGLTWDAIISKPMVDAIYYANITYPVYTLDDSLVASGGVAWDLQLNNSISLTQEGTKLANNVSKGTDREMIPSADFTGRGIWVRRGWSDLRDGSDKGQLRESLSLLPSMIPLRSSSTIGSPYLSNTVASIPDSNDARIGWSGRSQAVVSAIEVQQPGVPQNIFQLPWKR